MITILISILIASFAFLISRNHHRSVIGWTAGCFLFPALLNTLIQLGDSPRIGYKQAVIPLLLRVIPVSIISATIFIFSEPLSLSIYLRLFEAKIIGVFIPIQDISKEVVLTLANGSNLPITSSGRQAFAAAVIGLVLGATFTRNWIAFSVLFSLLGFFAGMLSRTISALWLVSFNYLPSPIPMFEILSFLLFLLSIIISIIITSKPPIRNQVPMDVLPVDQDPY